MDRYFVPSFVNGSEFMDHSDLGLRAADGWPKTLVFPNGVEYHRSNAQTVNGELYRVTYTSKLSHNIYVYND